MVTITLSLEDELVQTLQKLRLQTHLTYEEIIKRALVEYTNPSPPPDPLIGLFDFGDATVAKQAKEIVQAEIKSHL